MQINLNEIVKVKLTKAGKDHWKKYYQKLLGGRGIPVNIPEIPKDNILETELWNIMQVFGNGMYNGMPKVFFENNEIKLPVKLLKTQWAITVIDKIVEEIDYGEYTPEDLEPELSKLLKLFGKK